MFERGVLCIAVLLAASAARAADPPLQDPMRPYRATSDAPAAERAPQFRLTAVLIAASRRVATLNGKPRMVGDRFDGVEVVRIEPDHVVLKRDNQESIIHLSVRVADVAR